MRFLSGTIKIQSLEGRSGAMKTPPIQTQQLRLMTTDMPRFTTQLPVARLGKGVSKVFLSINQNGYRRGINQACTHSWLQPYQIQTKIYQLSTTSCGLLLRLLLHLLKSTSKSNLITIKRQLQYYIIDAYVNMLYSVTAVLKIPMREPPNINAQA